MTSLPNQQPRRQSGRGETAPISREFSPEPGRPKPPPELVGKTLSGAGCFFPSELHAQGATGVVFEVFRRYDRLAKLFGMPGTWASPETVATMGTSGRFEGVEAREFPDMPVRSVQAGLKWMIEHGWSRREKAVHLGRTVKVVWCRWLIPPMDFDAAVIDFGHGFRYRAEDGSVAPAGDRTRRKRAAPPTPDRAGSCANSAGEPSPIAQESAPESSKELKIEREALTAASATAPQSRGDESKTPDPTPPPPPSADARADRERAERLVRKLRDGGIVLKVAADPDRGEVIRPHRLSSSVGEMSEAARDELVRLRPHVLAYLKGQAGPATATARAATVAEAATLAEAVAVLGGVGAGAGEAEVQEVADRIADAWGDHKFRNLWVGQLRQVVAGTIPAEAFSKLMGLAESSNAPNKPALVQGRLKKLLARGPVAARPGA